LTDQAPLPEAHHTSTGEHPGTDWGEENEINVDNYGMAMYTLASTLEMIPGLALIWLFYLVPTVVIIATWWIIQKTLPLPAYEMAFIAILPFLVWSALTVANGSGKTMANAFGEPMILAGISAAALCLRILSKDKPYAAVVVLILYGAVLCCAFLLWLLMPGLPE
jgi:hypothetical protein